MAAERPIVATRIDGYAELLAPAGCARLVDSDDPAALADEIVILLDQPELRRTLGARGGAFVRALRLGPDCPAARVDLSGGAVTVDS